MTGHQVILFLWNVGEGDVEDLPIVVQIDHDAIHHGTPIGDLGFEERRVHLQALDDGGGNEVLDIDYDLIPLASDLHLRFGRLVDEELAVFFIGAEFDD